MTDNKKLIELTERIRDLRERFISDQNALVNAYYWDHDKDLRITSIKRLIRLMVGLNVSFLYLSNLDQTALETKVRLKSEEKVEINQYLIMNEIFIKMGFASSLFYLVEIAIKEYLFFIDKDAYKMNRAIGKKCTCLMNEKLEWDTYHFDCSVFDFLRLIRNTLHNNGVFIPDGNDRNISTVTYKGKEYIFRIGEKLDFVTWDLLFDIGADMGTLLFQIANNKTVRAIPGVIFDRIRES